MKRKGYLLSVATVAWIGIMSWVVTVHPQAGRGQVPAVATPGQAPATGSCRWWRRWTWRRTSRHRKRLVLVPDAMLDLSQQPRPQSRPVRRGDTAHDSGENL